MELVITLVVLAVVVVATLGYVVSRRSRVEDITAPPSRPTSPDVVVEDRRDAVETEVPEAAVEEEAPTDLVEPPVDTSVLEAPSLRTRLAKARSAFAGAIGSVLRRSQIDQDSWDDLEEALIRADVGVGLTQSVLDSVRGRMKELAISTPDELIVAVRNELRSRLGDPVPLRFSAVAPSVWLFVGVNGVGKTTTIGKVGYRLSQEGRSVVMAAGDTFRAAAAEQLETWAERSGAELVRGAEGGDPSSVIFDGIAHAAAGGADVVLADTAGRLHTKTNLMDELSKVRRVADKGAGEVSEVLLVLDATTGQNGLTQARQFADAVSLTGVVLTKLDGSAKGGIVFAIREELGIPVKLVGLGETAADLVDFDPDEFVEALFS